MSWMIHAVSPANRLVTHFSVLLMISHLLHFRKTITAVVPQRILLADNSQLLSSALSTHHWPPSACHAHSHLPHPPTITANTLPALTYQALLIMLAGWTSESRTTIFVAVSSLTLTDDSDRDNRTTSSSNKVDLTPSSIIGKRANKSRLRRLWKPSVTHWCKKYLP